MNWTACFLTAVFGAYLPMLISWRENTLLKRSDLPELRLTFFHHWGVCVADALLLPLINGVIWDHLQWLAWPTLPVAIALAATLTWLCHRSWWPNPHAPVYGLHFPGHHGSGGNQHRWWRDLSIAGWLHIFFMGAQLLLFGIYVRSAVPAYAVWTTAALMAVFPFAAVFQPSWAVHRRIDGGAWLAAYGIWGFTALVTADKLGFLS
ncbi:MAG: hypothetical protein G01um101431_297 [Parcubacteria group bacterium Gr01-1014_31]|nr:MAG: hypothetical protein G01um101431_297 [Parcubacteria group bacterium Gr01-1014_31]